MTEPAWLHLPDWQVPAGVQAFVTTRCSGQVKGGQDQGGQDLGGFGNFNLALHVGDDPQRVVANREQLLQELRARSGCNDLCIQWLEQVHGTSVHDARPPCRNDPPPRADALYTASAGIACAVLTADCLPVLFCSDDGREIAVAHAGWRGLLAGVLEQTLSRFETPPERLRAWLGPAIGPCHFEVGPEVREAFLEAGAHAAVQTAAAFRPVPPGSDGVQRYMMDLYRLARLRLAGLGSLGGELSCTQCRNDQWYSYRAAQVTGRFATLILKTGS